MRKLAQFCLLMLLALLGMTWSGGNVEAARIAVLPLVNKTQNKDGALEQLYYTEAIQTLNKMPEMFFDDNGALTASIEKNVPAGVMPEEQTLARIAQEGEVDLVFVMELDKLTIKEIHRLTSDIKKNLVLRGRTLAYSVNGPKVFKQNFSVNKTVLAGTETRWRWDQEEFAKQVQKQLRKAVLAGVPQAERIKYEANSSPLASLK